MRGLARWGRAAGAAAAMTVTAALPAQPTISVIPGEQMRADLAGSRVEPATGGAWRVVIRMANDNDLPNGVLPVGFRRWWHVRLSGLDPNVAEVLNVEVTNSEYSDTITPVWSLDGGQTYTRIDTTPTTNNNTIRFTLRPPAGTTTLRVAKYFPYTLAMYDAFREEFRTHRHVQESVIGLSEEGRPIWLYEFTNRSVPNTHKRRAWIHSAVHPSENTAFFNCEGLIRWLVGGSAEAERTLENLIITVVPMANPDGVYHGNYRTNARGVNIEPEWSAPYNSQVREIVALRTEIERLMGQENAPAPNPIELLLNLHAAHGSGGPFHFVHTGNYLVNGTGVLPLVRDLELRWVGLFRARSPFLARFPNDMTSALTGRPFVESMMHDRYTLSGVWPPVMAITFEGTYQAGPVPGVPGTDDDYREVGRAMGLAIADYFEIDLTAPGPAPEVWWML